MAVNKGLIFASVLLLVVSMKVAQIRADCDLNDIIVKLEACIPSVQNGAGPDATCCAALVSVRDTYNPTPDCICQICQNPLVIAVVPTAKMNEYLNTCVGPSFVPPCLG
jgi:hypothetical protein